MKHILKLHLFELEMLTYFSKNKVKVRERFDLGQSQT